MSDLHVTPAARRRPPSGSQRAIVGVALALLALIGAGAAATLHYEYRHEVDAIVAGSEQAALKVAARTAEVFDQVEQTFRLVAWTHPREAAPELSALAAAGVIVTQSTRSVLRADAAGFGVDSTSGELPLNIADEDDFKRLKAEPREALLIGVPALNPLSEQWSLPVYRRLSDAAGRFAGVVVVAVDPGALALPFTRGATDDTVVGILGRDSVYRVRAHGGTLSHGGRLDTAALAERVTRSKASRQPSLSPVDGKARFLAAVEVPRYPLLAVVGTDARTALAGYARTRALVLLASLALALIVLAAAWSLWSLSARLENSRAATARSDRAFRATIEGSLDAVAILRAERDATGRLVDLTVTDVNDRAAALVASRRDAMVGRSLCALVPSIRSGGFLAHFDWSIRHRRAASAVIQAEDPRIAGRWLHHQIVPLDDGAALVMRDITEAKEAERQLAALARFDSLTGLPNRRHFEESLTQARARALRSHQPLALLYVDLDGFKTVNDSLGHEGGDLLLQGVALRLLESVRATDLVARLGGDEFAVLLEAAGSETQIRDTCQRVLDALSAEHTIEGRPVTSTPSIGCVLLAGDEGEDSVRRRADEAMYDAKRAGKARFRLVVNAPQRVLAGAG